MEGFRYRLRQGKNRIRDPALCKIIAIVGIGNQRKVYADLIRSWRLMSHERINSSANKQFNILAIS
jgi:hypothetical protein